MKLIFSDHAWDDYLFWQNTDKKSSSSYQYPHQRNETKSI
nr:type II toxin-antitoxin system YoeB family toxin [Desulfosarcina sp. BuS5]